RRELVLVFCSSRRRHTSWPRDWSSDVCSSDLGQRGLRGDRKRRWGVHDRDHALSADTRGSLLIRFPVAAKTALASAGPVIEVPGSPIPPGASRLRTRWTSIGGASFIRSTL